LHNIGGSHAQRALFEQVYLNALLRIDAPTPSRGGIHANMPLSRYPIDSVVLS
jgi:hypothetical protein